MWEDPIVAEVQRTRKELAEKFDFDVQAIVADIRERQAALGSRLVSLAKRAEPGAAPDRGGTNGSPTAPSQQPPRQVTRSLVVIPDRGCVQVGERDPSRCSTCLW
jgi:hypothetical protein